MSRQIRVNVTRRDIERGQRFSPSGCPVVLAVGRHYPKKRHLLTLWHKGKVPPSRHNPALETDLPDEVEEWITRFDQGLPVEPFTFTFEGPDD